MDFLSGLKTIPKIIKQVFAGQKVRNDIIGNANKLATAIMTATGFTASRLNEALLATPAERVQILSKLTQNEIRSFERMNKQCALIYGSANALSRWCTTKEAVNVNISGRGDALQVLETLEEAEKGMQKFFNQLLSAPSEFKNLSDRQIERWLHRAIQKTCRATTAANKCVSDLSKLI